MKWPLATLDLEDPTNAAIWENSPARQRRLAVSRRGVQGDVGAAQGLVGPEPLPCVPDLVGRRWREPDSVMVFGASYADFFTRWANRSHRMEGVYTASTPWQDFQREFVASVVDDDASYYDKVQLLLEDAEVARHRVLLTDLCRASFVKLEASGSSASENLLAEHAASFNAYVVANRDWHLARLRQWRGNVLVGLGRLATAGLLHLLSDGDPHDSSWMRRSPSGVLDVRWEGRRLRVLRVPHPSAWGAAHPREGAPVLRALLRGEPLPQAAPPASPRSLGALRGPPGTRTTHTRVGTAEHKTSMSSRALWNQALQPAKALAAAELLARHPDAAQLTAQLLDDVSAERVVAIANAMFNPCRPSNLRKSGRETPAHAWKILLERRAAPFHRSGTKWARLVGALQPIPEDVRKRITAMDIEELGVLSAALIRGPYQAM